MKKAKVIYPKEVLDFLTERFTATEEDFKNNIDFATAVEDKETGKLHFNEIIYFDVSDVDDISKWIQVYIWDSSFTVTQGEVEQVINLNTKRQLDYSTRTVVISEDIQSIKIK